MKGRALGLYLGGKRELTRPGVVKGLPRVGGILVGLEEFRGERGKAPELGSHHTHSGAPSAQQRACLSQVVGMCLLNE